MAHRRARRGGGAQGAFALIEGPPACVGAILAGGEARRFGGAPKGLERIGGRRILERVADALARTVDRIVLVSSAPEAEEWLPGVAVVHDRIRGAGPLSGIHSALLSAGCPVLVVGWDMPFVSPALLAVLRIEGARSGAAAPESSPAGEVEPLCAYYSVEGLPAIERRLATGDTRLVDLLAELQATRIPFDRVCAFGDPGILFMNVNTRDDLARADALARKESDRHHVPPP